ncbi:MAG: response regulator, partial [Syntrophorhabdaceae bacterium]|nr:response regulator [Syntrophorhabdaceae bacterium]
MEMLKAVFVVDDNDTNLFMAKEALKDHFRVMTLPSAAKMFALMEKIIPDLILLDIKMPEVDGFEALRRLKNNNAYADIPVMFLTNVADASVEVRGFQMGVVDFITKPFSAPVLINRIKAHLDIDNTVRERTHQLQNKTAELQHLQNGMVLVIADMIENRDKDTGGHVDRTAALMKILLGAMIDYGVYASEICEMDLDMLISSARLHDVGKIAIPDMILNKPGKLTAEEFEIMKTHCAQGERIMDQIVSHTGDMEFLRTAKLFAGYHHEHWN